MSGGAKRELCVAIALSVAEAAKQTVSPSHHPSLVLLDEPTAGVDPYAKTKLWKAVENVMNFNQGAAVSSLPTMSSNAKKSAPPSGYSATASSYFAATPPTSKKSFPTMRLRHPR